jgi:hypothetical protein
MFTMKNGFLVKMSPEEAESGAAGSGPAGTESSSESESEFMSMGDAFEADSYDTDFADDDVEVETAAEEEAAPEPIEEEVADDEGVEEAETEFEADDSTDEGEEAGKEKEKDADEVEEAPQVMTSEELTVARNSYIDQMAEQFSISEEESDLLRTEPEKALPKLMARMATQTLEQAVQIMRNNLPQLVGSQLTQQSTAKEIEGKFFGKYPELNTKPAIKAAENAAKAYRAANPDADLDDVMDSVAFMTWKKLGLPMEKLSERMTSAKSEEFNPAGKARKAKPSFVPANPGKTGSDQRPGRQKASSEFEDLANLMQNDSMFDG